jgi:hypothetical protein
MDSLAIHHKCKILHWRLQENTLRFLQLDSHTLKTIQSSIEISQMFLVILTRNI